MPSLRPFSLDGRNVEDVVITIQANGLALFQVVDRTADHPWAREGYDVLLFLGFEKLVAGSVARGAS
jgi:hypothetical protein